MEDWYYKELFEIIKEDYEEYLQLSSFKEIDVTNELSQEEIADLTMRIDKVLEGFSQVEVEYNPYT